MSVSPEQIRADLALVNEIPLYAIPNDVEFTLDQHHAFQRLTDAIPVLLDRIAELEADNEIAWRQVADDAGV